jgi:hypothetical protein
LHLGRFLVRNGFRFVLAPKQPEIGSECTSIPVESDENEELFMLVDQSDPKFLA